jgi:hypothetical protein
MYVAENSSVNRQNVWWALTNIKFAYRRIYSLPAPLPHSAPTVFLLAHPTPPLLSTILPPCAAAALAPPPLTSGDCQAPPWASCDTQPTTTHRLRLGRAPLRADRHQRRHAPPSRPPLGHLHHYGTGPRPIS